MEITLGHVWYFMMYLSDNETVKFWGWINMLINNHSFIMVYSIVTIITTFLGYTVFKSFGFKSANSIFIGVILSYFVFFNIIVKQSSDITSYSFEQARKLYYEDKSAFAGYNALDFGKSSK